MIQILNIKKFHANLISKPFDVFIAGCSVFIQDYICSLKAFLKLKLVSSFFPVSIKNVTYGARKPN